MKNKLVKPTKTPPTGGSSALTIEQPSHELAPHELPKAEKTLENFAQILLEKGFTPEQLSKVTPSTILKAQKLILDKQKLSLQADSLKIAMLKLMSGLPQEKVIDGEESDE